MQENSLIDKLDPGSAGTYIYRCSAQTSQDVPFVSMQISFMELTAHQYTVEMCKCVKCKERHFQIARLITATLGRGHENLI